MSEPLFQSALAHVETRELDGKWQLIFTRAFPNQIATVWRVITAKEELPLWAPFRPSRDLTDVGDITLTMIDGETETPLECEVRTVEPPTLLEYTWDTDLLRWELVAQSEGTTVTLFHTMEDRDWVPKVAAGWHICFDVVQTILDGTPHDPIVGMDAMNHGWSELNVQYGELLGIETTND